MPAPLTPIEKYLRQDSNDRRTKYEQRRAAQGLVRVNVWIPAERREELARFCEDAVERHLAARTDAND